MSSTRKECVNEGDWTEKLIQEIQSRAPIYNKNLAEHSDRNKISGLWDEIGEIMAPTWNDMSAKEKSSKVKDLQSKWRNLRTCFRRELQKQTKKKSGQATCRRQKYMFFDQLLFLLPTMEDRPTVSECSPVESAVQNNHFTLDSDESELPEELELESQSIELSQISFGDANRLQPSILQQQQKKKRNFPDDHSKKEKRMTYEQSLLTILRQKKDEPEDEDRSFFMSLLPSVKKLSDFKKIELKMDILAALKRHSEPDRAYFSGYYQPQHMFHQGTVHYPSVSSTPNQSLSDLSQQSGIGNPTPLSPQSDLESI